MRQGHNQGGVTNQPRLAAWLKPFAIARAIRASLHPINLETLGCDLVSFEGSERLGKQGSERDTASCMVVGAWLAKPRT